MISPGATRDTGVERPYSSEFAEIGDPGCLNYVPTRLLRTARQKGVSPNPFDNGHSRDMHLLNRQILAEPVPDHGIVRPRQPALRTRVEQIRT